MTDLNELDARIAKFKKQLIDDGVMAKDWAEWDAEHEHGDWQSRSNTGASTGARQTYEDARASGSNHEGGLAAVEASHGSDEANNVGQDLRDETTGAKVGVSADQVAEARRSVGGDARITHQGDDPGVGHLGA